MRSFAVGNTELVIMELLSLSVRDAAGSSGGEAGLSAAEILDRLYASGELMREEYLKIRGDMTRGEDA